MDPITQSNESHKTTLIVIISIVLLLALGATIYFIQKEKTPEFSESQTPSPLETPITSTEKMRILSDLASATPSSAPAEQKEKMKILENLAKQSPPANASTSAEKMKILEALSATAGH